MNYRQYVESLYASGRREFGDLTQDEVARAIAYWCQSHPIDCVDDVTTDEHVQARLAHRLFEYFDALASGQVLTAKTAQLGVSSLLEHVARQRVEADIRRHFDTNRRLAELLASFKERAA
jgi:hypothetical protein